MPYVGLHIHKTAGTSLLRYLEEHAPLRLYGAYALRNFRYLELPLWATHNVTSKDIFWGHSIYESFFYNVADPIRLFTFLREPNERLLSWYSMLKRRGKLKRNAQSLELFAEAHSNSMSNMLIDRFPSLIRNTSTELHRQALDILEQMCFVGFQSHYSEHLPVLLEWLNVRQNSEHHKRRHNSAPSRGNLSSSENAILDIYNEQDNKLYSLALERFAENPINRQEGIIFLENVECASKQEQIRSRQVKAAQKKFLSSLRYSIGEVGLEQYITNVDATYEQCKARLTRSSPNSEAGRDKG